MPLESSTAVFGTKVTLKINFKKQPGKQRYEKKSLQMKLIRKDQKEELGCGEINLANYMKCLERKKFSIELKDSPFPEAMIEFAITATPSVGGRAAT